MTFFPAASGVYGPARAVFSHRLEGRVQGLGARFRPGTFRAFLDGPVRDIADRAVPLGEVFGPKAAEAAESVQCASDDAQMVSAVDNLLIANPSTRCRPPLGTPSRPWNQSRVIRELPAWRNCARILD